MAVAMAASAQRRRQVERGIPAAALGGEGDDRNTLAGAVLTAALAVVGDVEGVGDTAGDRLPHERFGSLVVLRASRHPERGHIDRAKAGVESDTDGKSAG